MSDLGDMFWVTEDWFGSATDFNLDEITSSLETETIYFLIHGVPFYLTGTASTNKTIVIGDDVDPIRETISYYTAMPHFNLSSIESRIKATIREEILAYHTHVFSSQRKIDGTKWAYDHDPRYVTFLLRRVEKKFVGYISVACQEAKYFVLCSRKLDTVEEVRNFFAVQIVHYDLEAGLGEIERVIFAAQSK